ncbi:MAG: RuBisCO large subunit C-terminal-like domain-containing protein, partial [Clostridia bacterium]
EIVATFRVQKGPGLEARAERMALGVAQGSGTDLPGASPERAWGYGGRVMDVDDTGKDTAVRIAYPAGSLPPQLSVVLVLVAGNLSLDGETRLEHLQLPDHFLHALPGPQHGVPGLRRRLSVPDRPLLMSSFKSPNGWEFDDWEKALHHQWEGGADLVTDDPACFEDSESNLLRRVERAREIAEQVARDEGRRPVYAFNLTASGPDLPAQAERLAAAGAEAFQISPYAVGLDMLTALTRLQARPIILAHPALSGPFTYAGRGLSPAVALGQLVRAAGADVSIYPSYPSYPSHPSGYDSEVSLTVSSADASAIGRALTRPGPRRPVWPAPEAGIHPGLLPALVRDVGPHVIVNAGGAIHAHPGGTRAGAAAFRQALDRLLGRGGPVPDELAQALARWGGAA